MRIALPARLIALLLAWLAACGPRPLEVEVVRLAGGVEVRASAPLGEVEILGPGGGVLVRRELDPPAERAWLPLPPGERASGVRVRPMRGGEVRAGVPPPPPGPVLVTLDAPEGQVPLPLVDGGTLEVLQPGGVPVRVGLTLTVLEPAAVRAHLGDATRAWSAPAPGQRLRLVAELAEDAQVVVEAGSWRLAARVRLRPVAPGALARSLVLEGVDFPADAWGRPDPARPGDRVVLPARWWRALVRATALGVRAEGSEVPHAWQAVRLRNRGERDLLVVVRARVLDAAGRPDPAFRPRLREADDGTGNVSVLLRVPAGERATAALPLFVDPAALPAAGARLGPWTRRVEVLALGVERPLATWTGPLVVQRGSSAVSLGLLSVGGVALGGLLLLAARLGRWLRERSTSELVTVALFAALVVGVRAGGQLAAIALSALLGPFSGLATALVDDAFRYALLATLVTLVPRRGTLGLAVLVDALVGGVALGQLGLVEFLVTLVRVALLEGLAWAFGVTRGPGWLAGAPGLRLVRLAGTFGLASAGGTAAVLVLYAALYRLFYAPWYVAILLAGPGFGYVAVACVLARPFADSLRRVAP